MGNTEKHPLDFSEVPAESIPTAYGSDLNNTQGSSCLTLPALTPTSCFTSHLKKLLPSPVSGFAFGDSQTKAIAAPAKKKLCIDIWQEPEKQDSIQSQRRIIQKSDLGVGMWKGAWGAILWLQT